MPTTTDRLKDRSAVSLVPTAVVLIQGGPWTYGVLANHIWSVAGDADRADVSATFIQPFLAYTTPTAWTFLVQTESTYDGETEEWSVPVNASISKLTTIGSQKVQFQLGGRYWTDSPLEGPEDFGVSRKITFLFPR